MNENVNYLSESCIDTKLYLSESETVCKITQTIFFRIN